MYNIVFQKQAICCKATQNQKCLLPTPFQKAMIIINVSTKFKAATTINFLKKLQALVFFHFLPRSSISFKSAYRASIYVYKKFKYNYCCFVEPPYKENRQTKSNSMNLLAMMLADKTKTNLTRDGLRNFF